MSSRRCLVQLHAYSRAADRFTSAEAWGASVAHHDLVDCFLAHEIVDDVLVLDPFANADGPSTLQNSPGNRIAAVSPRELQERATRSDLIFFESLGVAPRLARLRALLDVPAPVIGLLHTVPDFSSNGVYFWLHAAMQPRDTIIATSGAGHGAITRIMEHTAGAFTQPLPDVRRIPLPVDCRGLWGASAKTTRQTWNR
jgi:hypothetical protein